MKYDITFHPSWWYKNAGICFTQDFFDEPEYRMDCDVKMRKKLYECFGEYGIGEKNPQKRPLLGSDLLAAGYLYSELFGCRIIYEKDNSPQVICQNLDEEEMEDIQVPKLSESPVWQRTASQLEYLKSHYGYVETYVNLMGIQNIAMDIMGQNVFMAYYSAPEETEKLLEKITDLTISVGMEFQKYSKNLSGGVTGVIQKVMPECYLTSNCSVEMISNQLYEEFLLKCDQKLADHFGNFGIHHCGGTMEHVADGYAKVNGLVFAEVGAGSDIRTVREKMPDIWLNARFSPVDLKVNSASEIEEKVELLIREGNNPEGKISISCVGIDADVEIEKIRTFLEACRKVSL